MSAALAPRGTPRTAYGSRGKGEAAEATAETGRHGGRPHWRGAGGARLGRRPAGPGASGATGGRVAARCIGGQGRGGCTRSRRGVREARPERDSQKKNKSGGVESPTRESSLAHSQIRAATCPVPLDLTHTPTRLNNHAAPDVVLDAVHLLPPRPERDRRPGDAVPGGRARCGARPGSRPPLLRRRPHQCGARPDAGHCWCVCACRKGCEEGGVGGVISRDAARAPVERACALAPSEGLPLPPGQPPPPRLAALALSPPPPPA